jgi:hypothetical protein
MPVIETTVTLTIWVCDLCGTHATQPDMAPSALAAQHFIDTLGWRQLGDLTVCDRCRKAPIVAALEPAADDEDDG